MRVSVFKHTYIHTYMHAYIHTYIHTCADLKPKAAQGLTELNAKLEETMRVSENQCFDYFEDSYKHVENACGIVVHDLS